MATSLRWGILATGSIAHAFAKGVAASTTGTLVAVGSRSMESAKKFTDQHGGRPHASYESLLADPEVDAVYIATPHHLHEEWTIKTARAGKGILCEKPFTLNALEAETALAAVKECGVFFMEAFMYRCHPATLQLKRLVQDGAIGRLLNLNAEFGFHASEDWTNFRADGALGGGGLMDVGTYCVSMARLIAGEEPTVCHYVADITNKGYDAQGSGVMKFPSGVTAHFGTGIHANLRNDVRIYGSEGWIQVDSPWFAGAKPIVLHRNGKEPEVIASPTDADLYALEADAVAEFFEAKECPYMSVADTLGQMRTLDALRASAGLHFAMERKA